MRLLSGFVSLAILSATIVSSFPIIQRDVDEALVPQFGFSAGVNPTGTGDCDGAVNGTDGQPVKIPCSCPPDRASFIQSLNANVAAGHVVNNPSVPISFPEDNSTASQLARINAATVTLQNLNGTGQGCPVASTTFQAQSAAIDTTGPRVIKAILRDTESAPPVISPIPDILKARDPVSASLPPPTPTVSVLGPLGSTLAANNSETALSTAPIPTFNPHHIIEDILKVRDWESASSPAPTTTVSGIDPLVTILMASDSETASSSAPIPTHSFHFRPVIEDIL